MIGFRDARNDRWSTIGRYCSCAVLYVSLAMASLHLRRHKLIFFIGALFITLVVGVHLTSYFPSVSELVSSSVVVFDLQASCISWLHDIVWDIGERKGFDSLIHNSVNYNKTWSWKQSAPVVACEFQKFTPMQASELLHGSWIVVAGDSQARLVTLSLLNLVLDSEHMEIVRSDLFKRHSDYQTSLEDIGVKLDFFWAPYAENLTDLVAEFKTNRTFPDVLVIGSGLWHMLQIWNSSHYSESLNNLKNSVAAALVPYPATSSTSIGSPHLFWIGMPRLINSMLNTEEKRKKMTATARDGYDNALHRSKLLQNPASSSHFLLLDIESLSSNCGIKCTIDGMHYDGVVYEAAVHILLNALLIETHEKL